MHSDSSSSPPPRFGHTPSPPPLLTPPPPLPSTSYSRDTQATLHIPETSDVTMHQAHLDFLHDIVMAPTREHMLHQPRAMTVPRPIPRKTGPVPSPVPQTRPAAPPISRWSTTATTPAAQGRTLAAVEGRVNRLNTSLTMVRSTVPGAPEAGYIPNIPSLASPNKPMIDQLSVIITLAETCAQQCRMLRDARRAAPIRTPDEPNQTQEPSHSLSAWNMNQDDAIVLLTHMIRLGSVTGMTTKAERKQRPPAIPVTRWQKALIPNQGFTIIPQLPMRCTYCRRTQTVLVESKDKIDIFKCIDCGEKTIATRS